MLAQHMPAQLQGVLHEHDVAEDPALVEQHEQTLAHAAGRHREAILLHRAVRVGESAPVLAGRPVHVRHAPLPLGGRLGGQPLLRLE